jgi:hypothetical protein
MRQLWWLTLPLMWKVVSPENINSSRNSCELVIFYLIVDRNPISPGSLLPVPYGSPEYCKHVRAVSILEFCAPLLAECLVQ